MKVQFKELRETYKEIKDLLENTSGESVDGLNTKIAEDLGLWGDDNYELLEEFVKKNNLNFDKFDYSEHFESEGEIFNSRNALITLLALPFWVINVIVRFVFRKIKLPFENLFLFLPMENKRSDLTFGDLIVCKLKGEFCLRKDTLIEV